LGAAPLVSDLYMQLAIILAAPSDKGHLYRYDFPGWWHSQAGQDHTVHAVLKDTVKTGGYFVDLASNLPVEYSNTRALERDFGWRGLCIEAEPHLVQALRQGRACTVVQALVSSSATNKAQLNVRIDDKASNLERLTGKARAVPCARDPTAAAASCQRTMPLASILDAHAAPSVIDYMSLDCEGCEDAALLHFPFERYRIRMLTVERPSAALSQRLREVGLRYAFDQGWFGDQLFLAGAPTLPHGFNQSAKRAQRAYDAWIQTMHSENFTRSRSGRGPHAPSLVSCCGVPQDWVAKGQAPPLPDAQFEGRNITCGRCY